MSIDKSTPKPQDFANEAIDIEAGEDAEAVKAPETKSAPTPAKGAQAASPQANGDTRRV